MAGDPMFGNSKMGFYIGYVAGNAVGGLNVYGPDCVASTLRWMKTQPNPKGHTLKLHLEGPAYAEQTVADFISSDDMFQGLCVRFHDESLMRAVCVGLWHSRRAFLMEIAIYNGQHIELLCSHVTFAMRLNPFIRAIPVPVGNFTQDVFRAASKRADELGHPTMQDVCWYWLLDPQRPKLKPRPEDEE